MISMVGSGESSLPNLQMAAFSLCPHAAERERETEREGGRGKGRERSSSYKATVLLGYELTCGLI